MENIKIHELRIGNKVAMKSITVKEDITVTGVIENKIYYTPCKTPKFADFLWSLPVYIYPIPLTEDWLIKLGFKKVEDLGDMIYYQVNEGRRGYGVQYNHEEWVFYLYAGNETTTLIYDDVIFQNVHQLQNLYFALTGEELHTQAGGV
jgi:hypothetical protein